MNTRNDAAAAPALRGLRIVEFPAFVAAPRGGLALAQLGADVIRVDPIGGKRSVEIDGRRPQGKRLLQDLIVAEGDGGGIFVTNLPVDGDLAYEALRRRHRDVIVVQLSGFPDGAKRRVLAIVAQESGRTRAV